MKTSSNNIAAGQDPLIGRPSMQDWANFISIQPQLYFRPQNTEELKNFLTSLNQAPLNKWRPRVLGGLHSCSEICVSDAIIDVGELPKTIDFNDDHSAVIVSTNWHLHEFLLELSKYGKSILATGGTDEQTLAGIISTDTAPATPQNTIYELVDWVEYITLDKQNKTVVEKRVSKDQPEFRAVICSLGAIGILTRAQFRLVDELYFETIQKPLKLTEILTDLAQTSKKYDFWRIDWLPDTEEGLLWAARQIAPTHPEGDYAADRSEYLLKALFKGLERFESAGPLLDNAMRLIYSGLILTYKEIKVSGPLRNMLPVDRRAPVKVAMAEWSFDPGQLPAVLQSCKDYFKQNGWPNLPIEIELTRTDNYYMSPWNWPGLDFIVKFNFMYLTDISQTDAGKKEIMDHLQGLWNHLMKKDIHFKAHWGKINFMDPQFVREHFEFDQFKPFIRPMFVNQYLATRFGLDAK